MDDARDPGAFPAAGEPDGRRDDARRLDAIFREVTGRQRGLWSPGIPGRGRYDSGRSGSYRATGLAPRKANLVVYIMPGYADFSPILDRLGPHRKGRSCLYLTRLGKVDETALRELIRGGLDDLATHWPVHRD